jgi:Skp family chaperone for outer membrane proteins
MSQRNRKYDYLLAGHMQCGQCGRRMAGQCDTRSTRRYYKCTHPRFQAETPCRGAVGAEGLEQVVWSAVEGVLKNPALVTQEVERRKANAALGQDEIDTQRRFYQAEIAKCEREVDKWERAYLDDALDTKGLKEKKAEIAVRCASLEQEIARLNKQQEILVHAELETASLMTYCQRVAENLTNFGFADKRRAIEALGITVVWSREKPLAINGSIPVAIEDYSTCCSSTPGHARWCR